MILIDAADLAASRPNRPLFAGVSLTVADGDRVGVVGINGCGKSTLLRMLARELDAEAGEVRWGRGVRVGFLPQQPVLPAGTVRDAVGGGWQGAAMLDRLGMAGLVDARTDELSGGQAKRTALARLLIGEHEVLILDEPTNHLDLDAIQFLEEWLAGYRGGLVLVTHDRHVLDRVTTKVLEIDRGSAYLHVPQGYTEGSGYAAYLAGRAEREERAQAASPPVDLLKGAAEAIACEAPGERCTVAYDYVAAARQHPSELAKQVRARPVSSPVAGIRIDGITTGSIAEQVGMQTGDVVTHVNGIAVGSMQDAMLLYMNLRAARSFVVDYRRGEQEHTLQVDVV